MTTIAYKDGVMAADGMTYICDGQVRMPGNIRKIKRLQSGGLMGHAGSVSTSRQVEDWVIFGEPKGEPQPKLSDEGGMVIVAYPDRRLRLFDGSSERWIEEADF